MIIIIITENYFIMKTYYYFVLMAGRMMPGQIVFKVAVGKSLREQTKAALIEQYAKDCGFYFHVVSEQADNALRLMSKGIMPKKAYFVSPYRIVYINVEKLYKKIMDGTLTLFSENLPMTQTEKRFKLYLNKEVQREINNQSCNTHRLPQKRKNLSDDYMTLSQYVFTPILLILVLGLLDIIITQVIG